MRDTGNLFLTNIHRVYLGDVREPSLDDEDLRDYFLDPFGPKPVGKTTDGKQVLNDIARITGFAGAPALIQAMFVAWTHDGVQIPKELTAFREYLASL